MKPQKARGNQRQSEAIRGNQRQSEAIRGDQRQSEAIRGNPRQSEAIRGNQRQSEAIRGNQRQSEAIRGNPRRSEVIRGNQRQSEAIRGNPRQSEAIRGNQGIAYWSARVESHLTSWLLFVPGWLKSCTAAAKRPAKVWRGESAQPDALSVGEAARLDESWAPIAAMTEGGVVSSSRFGPDDRCAPS